MKKIISGNIDRPIFNRNEDFLDRFKFAEYIYSILENLPADSNIRIGIEGPWGSGKSSMMKLLHDECRKGGNFTAYFNPWQFNEWDLAWSGLVTAIGKGLSEGKNGKISPFKRKHYIKKGKEYILKGITLATKLPYIDVAAKIGDLLISPLLSNLEETKQSVIDYLSLELGDKRMFIFIDDLDRANEQVIYNLLMFLNEVIDFNKIVYIIGLDVEVTKFTLGNRIKDVDSFLEKIINWSFKLPNPSEFDWDIYIKNQLKSLSGGIKKKSLLSLSNVLPKNPRKLKLFIYYLDGLHRSFLKRFDDDELHWDIVYLIQLLRNEFPKAFDHILNDKQLIGDLSYGSVRDRVGERVNAGRREEHEEPEWKDKLKTDLPKDERERINRLFELYETIRNSRLIISEEVLSYHLRVIDSPDLITWREYRDIKKEVVNAPKGQRKDKLKEVLFRNTSHKAVMWRREFFNTLLMDRNALFEGAIQHKVDKDIQEALKAVFDLNDILELSFEIEDLFKGDNPVYNIDLFKKIIEKFKHWSHFDKPEHIYRELRDNEKSILVTLISKMVNQESSLLIALGIGRHDHPFPGGGPEEAFRPIKNEMIKILSDKVAQSLLNNFTKFDGIASLWPSNENKIAELNILFNPNPSFHNEIIYRKLSEIITQISDVPFIRDNFYEYFSMLCHASLKPSSFSTTENALVLIKNNDFISILWEGTVGEGLNLRCIGSLNQYREDLRKHHNIKVDELLPVPTWWEAVLKGEEIK